MRWAIGLDFRREGKGALAFAHWLRAGDTGDKFVGLHALESSPLLQALREPGEEQRALDAARSLALKDLAKADMTGIEGPTVLDGELPGEALVRALEEVEAQALIIGRRAERNDARWLRLGPVARRLLRRLPGPLVVVPPDLAEDQIGDGPVVLASDLRDDSVGAAAFARQVARARDRDVVVAHIVPTSEDVEQFMPAATVQQLYDQIGMDRRDSMEKWKREVGLEHAPSAVASGETVERLMGIANAEKAPMIVSGSRRTSGLARLFTASVSARSPSEHSATPLSSVLQ